MSTKKATKTIGKKATKKTATKVVKAKGINARIAEAHPIENHLPVNSDNTPKPEKPSALNIAAQILSESGKPMNAKEMIEQMLAKGLWKTEGKTPAATLYSAIFMEIKKKGAASRFRKASKGSFELNR